MKIEEIIARFFKGQRDVLCVYLFGSAVTGRENRFSDVDIAVLFDSTVRQGQYTEKRLGLMDGLSGALDKDVDVVVLNNASSFLRFQILKNGKRIYERPGRQGHNFEAEAIVEYFDFLPIRKRMEAAMIRNIKEG